MTIKQRKALNILELIEEDDYKLYRPSIYLFRELVNVINYLHEEIKLLKNEKE